MGTTFFVLLLTTLLIRSILFSVRNGVCVGEGSEEECGTVAKSVGKQSDMARREHRHEHQLFSGHPPAFL